MKYSKIAWFLLCFGTGFALSTYYLNLRGPAERPTKDCTYECSDQFIGPVSPDCRIRCDK